LAGGEHADEKKGGGKRGGKKGKPVKPCQYGGTFLILLEGRGNGRPEERKKWGNGESSIAGGSL